MSEILPTKQKKLVSRAKVNRAIFMALLLIFPLTQFFVFYVMVNFNSIFLAFKQYIGNDQYLWVGLNNFKEVLVTFVQDPAMGVMLSNSAIMALFGIIMIMLNCIVTYMIFKKTLGSGFFKILLFLPSAISSIVLVVIFRHIIQDVLPIVTQVEKIGELLNAPQGFFTMLTLSCIFGFGPAVLVFLGSMSTIEHSILEYGKIDGMNSIREFWHIVLPNIYPTIISYTVITLATFFSNYGLIFAFFDVNKADITMRTLGYDLFIKVYGNVNYFGYPTIAATGLLYTVLTIPIVFIAKALMEKLGPREI